MCAVVVVCTFAWAFVVLPRFGRPGLSMVFFVLVPSLATMQLGLEWIASGAPYARLEQSITASVDPRFPEIVLCRHCGAALTLHEQALFARCAYCSAHDLVRNPKPAAYRYVRSVSQVGREQLAEAISALQTIFFQRTIVRWVGGGMSVAIIAVLAFLLRNT
jgi:DNA-directed RNA polymerase subunit RPC12/RpoP